MACDWLLGEPRRAHPLVGFGRAARWIEQKLYRDARRAGVLAWALAVLPLVGLAGVAQSQLRGFAGIAFGVAVLYLAVGHRSLVEHARPVADALERGDLDAARTRVGRMVSRDTAALDACEVAAAATESVLENGSDAVFAALFWFALLGAPGAVLYRLANTLDAMWGYRNARYGHFGWAAARADDVLNWLPARLTASTYALFGGAPAWRCWRRQAAQWDSPNAGPVMAAGAGALGVRLGGPAPYEGVWEHRPVLGEGGDPGAASVRAALALVRRGVLLWLAVAWAATLVWEPCHA
ncbi:adenosylcobinamide-phosphate synthase CbiB [Dyella sp. BiH032]|uniref:adenosylcobinamide-phosphate synthase CbiB n=1 Tax=Dyella sp. BiH032 TaxID=3075430 RepID=UPI002892C905|nr:adenosylcobinamide-phosphate synthase CbiB [Dyella sp. BiH032]WNL48296.1 adenosylcobinamide-phosphate synthase CbiB [Dyella sp. BiH032]